MLVAVVVLLSGWRLLVDALHILMEGTPPDLDLVELQRQCQARFDIEGLHHLHAWETGGGERMLTAHIRLCDQPLSQVETTITDLRRYLAEHWHVQHVTLEPEFEGCGSDRLIECGCHQAAASAKRTGATPE
jgi:cobalt-zinc-cadmium efflux system protein